MGLAFTPTRLNDLVVDVSLTSVARGDILYRGASKWNNLAPGNAGDVLTSGGAGADPSWAAASGGAPFADTTSIVKGSADATKLLRFEVDGFTTGTTRVLTPPDQNGTIAVLEAANTFTTGKQTIQTGADGTIGLDVTGNSATQTAKLLRCLRSSGGAVRFEVDPTGYIMIDDGSGGAIIKESGGNTIFRGIRTTGWADTQTSTFFQIGESSGKTILCTASGQSANRFMIDALSMQISDIGYNSVPAPSTDCLLELLLYTAETTTAPAEFIISHRSAGTPAANFGATMKFRLKSSTTNEQDAGSLYNRWNVATHASRTSEIGIMTVTNAGALAEVARFDGGGGATPTAGNTGLMLWDVDNATLERVTVGAADSGGTGYKVLRIPN